MKSVRVALGKRAYDVLIGRSIIKRAGALIRPLNLGKDAVVITNRPLAARYGAKLRKTLERSGFTARFLLVPDSEKAKSSLVATRLLKRLSALDRRKDMFLIALGGGVIGDVAGFVASVYKRGVPFVQIPTTLLAQVDSAIGGKVAIDLPAAKNLVGAFYQPRLVISDADLLATLSLRHLKSGLAEVIKYGIIKDPKLFDFLEASYSKVLGRRPAALEFIVSRSAAIKAAVVARDEFDKEGLRVSLNLGHTIGHAVETASGYSSRYTHGEAVAIGIMAAVYIASQMRILRKRDAVRISSLIEAVGLPLSATKLRPGRIYEATLHDKKILKKANRFVLPAGIGRIRVVRGVPGAMVRSAIKEITCHTR